LYLVIECKRVADEKQWIFFRHLRPQYRVSRTVGGGFPQNRFTRPISTDTRVCSEGFEYPIRNKSSDLVAEQDPVFKAAAQLCAAYIGFMQDRINQGGLPARGEQIVPLLVTTARLSIVLNKFDSAPLT